MTPKPTSAAKSLRRLAGALSIGLLGATVAAADDPRPGPNPVAAVEDSLQLGAKYFDQAIAWVSKGGAIGATRDLYAHLDVKWDLDDRHDEGVEEVWFQTPDRLRTTMTVATEGTTKILNGERAWAIRANIGVQRLHGTPDGAAALKQLKEDLVRIQDLTAFVTLEGLKGPGVVFEFLGEKTGTKGTIYEGSWLKVNRRSPDGRKMTFWLSFEKDASGAAHATWPGVVRVDGDDAHGLPTEDWVLKDWENAKAAPRAFRYPFKIQGWQLSPSADPAVQKAHPPHRFVFAVVDDIQVNQGIDPAKFEPPPK